MTAHRVQELGLGIALDRNTITAQELRAAVERVMGDPGYRSRVQKMQQQVRDAGGYRRAAAVILHYEQTHHTSISAMDSRTQVG